MDIEQKVKELIIYETGVDPELVTAEANLYTTLGSDSLDAVEIVMAMEEEFGIDITDEEAEKWQTVGDVVKYIQAVAPE